MAGEWTADEVAQDFDLQFTCAGLALGLAAALLEGPAATSAMVDLMALWPEEVPEAAGIVGYRVAMILAATHDLTPEHLGELSAHILSETTKEAGT